MKLIIILLALLTPWADDIHNPDNEEYIVEVAFNLDIPVDSVTQKQFNARYEHL
tara:strand:- start:366 stop:527 length:162 start_codon:yes stop_codon:yes gene_type:complete